MQSADRTATVHEERTTAFTSMQKRSHKSCDKNNIISRIFYCLCFMFSLYNFLCYIKYIEVQFLLFIPRHIYPNDNPYFLRCWMNWLRLLMLRFDIMSLIGGASEAIRFHMYGTCTRIMFYDDDDNFTQNPEDTLFEIIKHFNYC